MSTSFDWTLPPLDSADERLVEAYRAVGRPLDDLAYTPEFDSILRRLGVDATDEVRHSIYRRLLSLRKSGRLPRISRFIES